MSSNDNTRGQDRPRRSLLTGFRQLFVGVGRSRRREAERRQRAVELAAWNSARRDLEAHFGLHDVPPPARVRTHAELVELLARQHPLSYDGPLSPSPLRTTVQLAHDEPGSSSAPVLDSIPTEPPPAYTASTEADELAILNAAATPASFGRTPRRYMYACSGSHLTFLEASSDDRGDPRASRYPTSRPPSPFPVHGLPARPASVRIHHPRTASTPVPRIVVIDADLENVPLGATPPLSIATEGAETCPICYLDLPRKYALTRCCQHVFCVACITQAVQRQHLCPICRRAIRNMSEVAVIKAGSQFSPMTKLSLAVKRKSRAACRVVRTALYHLACAILFPPLAVLRWLIPTLAIGSGVFGLIGFIGGIIYWAGALNGTTEASSGFSGEE